MPFNAFSYMNFTLSGDLTSGTLIQGTGIVQPLDTTFTETSGAVADTFEVGETYSVPTLIGDYVYQGFYDGAPVGRLYLFQSTNDPDVFIFASVFNATSPGVDPSPGDWPDGVLAQDLIKTNLPHCFAAGTQIATPGGAVSVEDLEIGQYVRTAEGASVPVKWVGRQTLDRFHAASTWRPVRIRAGALGQGLPMADLIVTGDHGMVMDGLVITASALVNGGSVDWLPMAELPATMTVYHVETEAHDAIMANGAPAETFVDFASRRAFDNYQEYLDLYESERLIAAMPAPRVSSQRLLPNAIKARLGIAGGDPAQVVTLKQTA